MSDDLKRNISFEFNFGEAEGSSVYDTSGNSNRGILIGDYALDKIDKDIPVSRESSIDIPDKESKNSAF